MNILLILSSSLFLASEVIALLRCVSLSWRLMSVLYVSDEEAIDVFGLID